MPIDVKCPSCGAVLPAPDEFAGKKIRCADCEAIMPVPSNDAPPPFPDAEPLSATPRREEEVVTAPRVMNWDEPRTPSGQKPNVLAGGAIGWLLLLLIFSLGGLGILVMAFLPL